MKSDGLFSTTLIAKDYGYKSAIELNKILKELGVQYKLGKDWVLKANYSGKGYMKSETVETKSGKIITYNKWTQSGRLFIYEILKRNDILPLCERED